MLSYGVLLASWHILWKEVEILVGNKLQSSGRRSLQTGHKPLAAYQTLDHNEPRGWVASFEAWHVQLLALRSA
jgi:hypothetical protein